MTWVRTEENAPTHTKFFLAGVAAYGWFVAALCYCSRELTDGFAPSRALELVFPGTPTQTVMELVETLVRERVLHVVGPQQPAECAHRQCNSVEAREAGYLIHDYAHYQPLKKDVIKERARLHRVRRKSGRQGGINSGVSRRRTNEANAKQTPEAKRSPVPSRPVPLEAKQRERGNRGVADADFLAGLRSNPAYRGIDFDVEMGKLDAWLQTPRGRGKLKSRQRIVNWLNRVERPVDGAGPRDPYAGQAHLYDCARCGVAHPTKGCPKVTA